MMKMTLIIQYEKDVLTAVIGGPFSLEEAQRTFGEIVQAVVQSRVTKVLVDGRDVTGEIEILKRFFYGMFAGETVMAALPKLKTPPRFAYVLNPPVLDENRFGETVARSKGMLVKAFPQLDMATEWLHADSAISPSP